MATAPAVARRPASLANLSALIRPNAVVPHHLMRLTGAVWIGLLLLLWLAKPFDVLPTPGEVLHALGKLWQQGLAIHLWASVRLNFEAIVISSLISLTVSYLTVLPLVRTPARLIATGRFLGLTGITLIFTLLLGGGHQLKLWLLVLGMTVFYVTTMSREVANINSERYDHAYTLRMGRWRAVWEIAILGDRHHAIEALRQNAAIGWMMLTMVEGISRSEGGIGVLLLDQNKHFKLAEVYAIQLMILLIGLVFDAALGALKRSMAPYAEMTIVRR